MRILVVEPGKAPEEKVITGTLEEMQEIVGGTIQALYPFKSQVALICNDEGKLLGLPLNRTITEGKHPMDIIAGTFFLCGLGEEDFASLTDEQMETYKSMFRSPEAFLKVNGGIISISIEVEEPSQ